MSIIKLSYRPEIDGLRAIAVLSVILYHAKIEEFGKNDWFEGGFIGVDIFFVISGYLITRIILFEYESTGSFSFIKFYERRARRILPMLFVVIFSSIPFAWQILLPSSLIEFAKSILSSLYFGSNYFFYFSTTEYGADSSLLKPFLHTWSLGVEEQFYLVFPIIAILTLKFLRQYFFYVLVLLSTLSLFLSEFMTTWNSALNFYLPFSRFWEISIGSILAFRELNYKRNYDNFLIRILPIIGFLIIAYSIFSFDDRTPHPSLYTLLPIFGIALIIVFASKGDLFVRIIGSKPLVWLGLVSYSAYLWHFPIFAFYRLGVETLSGLNKYEMIMLTFALSFLSYFFIERPFRKSVSVKLFSLTILLSGLLILSFSLYTINSDGFENRLGFNSQIIESTEPNYLFGDDGCNKKVAFYIDKTQFCKFGQINNSKIDFMLLGDSHAMHAQTLLNDLALKNGLKGVYGGGSGCPPLLGIYPWRGKPHPNEKSKRCFEIIHYGLEFVKKNNIETVFLIAKWNYYVEANIGSIYPITDASNVFPQDDIDTMRYYKRKYYNEGVKRTFDAFNNLDTRLVVMLQVPYQNINVKNFLESIIDDKNPMQKINEALDRGVLRSDHLSRQIDASSKWKELGTTFKNSNFIIIDPTDEFCGPINCPFITDEYSLYTDFDHASELGFKKLELKFFKALGL